MSPPSILAVAVAGSGSPVVTRLKATQGAPTSPAGTAESMGRRGGGGPGPREGAAQQQRPEGRGGAGHVDAGIVDEAVPLGQVPREVEVNPGVVEGKAAAPGELALPHEEDPAGEGRRGRG